MKDFEGIEIRKIEAIKEAKGPTYELFKGEQGLQVTVYKRNSGFSFADHYHKGHDASKNPEKFFVAKGKVRLTAKNPKNQDLDVIVDEGSELLISPDVLHRFEALTEVIFIEYRSTVFNKKEPDTFPGDSYEDYIESKKR